MASLLPTSIHRQLLLLMVLLSNAAPGIAQPSSQSLVREVLSCTRAEERFVIARDEGFKVGFNSASGPQALPEPLKQEIFALFRRIADDVYSWQTMEPRFVRLYQRYYTREQLEAIREYWHGSHLPGHRGHRTAHASGCHAHRQRVSTRAATPSPGGDSRALRAILQVTTV